MARPNDTALATILVFAFAIATGVPASACSVALQAKTPAQVAADARERFTAAPLVVDGEVLVPMAFGNEKGQMPMAILRVEKVLKGAEIPGDIIAVVYASSCDVTFSQKGEKVRVLLADGPTVYRARSTDQGSATDRENAQAEFNGEIDRLSGRARPEGYSIYPGAEEPPDPANASASIPPASNAGQPVSRGFEGSRVRDMLGIAALILSPIGLIYSATGITKGVTDRRWLLLGLCVSCAAQSLLTMIYFGMRLLPILGS
jgi:hypothetical protein